MASLAQALLEGNPMIEPAKVPDSCLTCGRWRMAKFDGYETCAGCWRAVEDCVGEPLSAK